MSIEGTSTSKPMQYSSDGTVSQKAAEPDMKYVSDFNKLLNSGTKEVSSDATETTEATEVPDEVSRVTESIEQFNSLEQLGTTAQAEKRLQETNYSSSDPSEIIQNSSN